MKLVEYTDTNGEMRLIPELFKEILDHVSEMDLDDPKEVAGLNRFIEKLKELKIKNDEKRGRYEAYDR